jgi:hypothetical protein
MDEEYYDDYRDSLLEYGSRSDEAYERMKQDELDDATERRLKSSSGINPHLDFIPNEAA